MLAVAGSLAAKKICAARCGHAADTYPAFYPVFGKRVIIVGALTFFPALGWDDS